MKAPLPPKHHVVYSLLAVGRAKEGRSRCLVPLSLVSFSTSGGSVRKSSRLLIVSNAALRAIHPSSTPLNMQQEGRSAKALSFPLEKLESCDLCSGTSTLRLCSGCGEVCSQYLSSHTSRGLCVQRVYCSKECQVKDWSNHKMTCSKFYYRLPPLLHRVG